jgi:hypothetical protein
VPRSSPLYSECQALYSVGRVGWGTCRKGTFLKALHCHSKDYAFVTLCSFKQGLAAWVPKLLLHGSKRLHRPTLEKAGTGFSGLLNCLNHPGKTHTQDPWSYLENDTPTPPSPPPCLAEQHPDHGPLHQVLPSPAMESFFIEI